MRHFHMTSFLALSMIFTSTLHANRIHKMIEDKKVSGDFIIKAIRNLPPESNEPLEANEAGLTPLAVAILENRQDVVELFLFFEITNLRGGPSFETLAEFAFRREQLANLHVFLLFFEYYRAQQLSSANAIKAARKEQMRFRAKQIPQKHILDEPLEILGSAMDRLTFEAPQFELDSILPTSSNQ